MAALPPVTTWAAEPSWEIISNGADDSQLSTDLARLRCSQTICSASEKTSYLRQLANGASSVEDEVEYDCQQALTRTLGERLVDADGHELRRMAGASPWSPVGLGTVGFESMRFACREGRATTATAQALEQTTPAASQPPTANPLAVTPRDSRSPQPVVQVVSSPTEAGARGALREFVRLHPEAARLSGGVERAVTHGRVAYRAVVSGFSARQAAANFCSRVRERGGDCVARLAGM